MAGGLSLNKFISRNLGSLCWQALTSANGIAAGTIF